MQQPQTRAFSVAGQDLNLRPRRVQCNRELLRHRGGVAPMREPKSDTGSDSKAGPLQVIETIRIVDSEELRDRQLP